MEFWFAVLSVAALLAPNLVLAQAGGELLKQGQEVYENNCSDCHRSSGEGLPVKFPALKGNAYVKENPNPVIGTVLNGRREISDRCQHGKNCSTTTRSPRQ